MKKIVVTGGAGFIGYHLSKLLLKMNYEIIVFDNFSDYYSPKLKRLNSKELNELGANIIEGSILEKEDLETAFRNEIYIVFHFAAQPGIRYSSANPEMSLRTNVEGTSQVISTCYQNGIKKIIIASSSSVFGVKEYHSIDENHPKNPISYYGASKLAAEKIVDVTRHMCPDMDISIIRPFTVIGIRQRPDMAINSFVSNALNEKEIIIYGDGEQTRDWTHVENIAGAAHLIVTNSNIRNEDFNIGSGISTSVNEVLTMISEITGKELKIKYKSFDKVEAKDTLANIGKAKKLLGYKPEKSLKIAIEEFIEDYQNIINKIK